MHKTAAKARIEVSIKARVLKMIQSDFCQTRGVNLATEAIQAIVIMSSHQLQLSIIGDTLRLTILVL